MQQSKLYKANIVSDLLEDVADFSLVLGGPLYQLYLKTRLARQPLDLLRRRIVGISLICWGPPLLLALLAGHMFGGVSEPFLTDLGVHIRFLVALPLLIGGFVALALTGLKLGDIRTRAHTSMQSPVEVTSD